MVTDGALVAHEVVPGVGLLVDHALHEADGADGYGSFGCGAVGNAAVGCGAVCVAHRRLTSTRGITARMDLPASWYWITVSSCSLVVTSRSSSLSAR